MSRRTLTYFDATRFVDVSGDGVKPNDGVAPSEIRYDADEEVAILSWDSPLPLGKAVLSMTFSGELNDKMKVSIFVLLSSRC